MAICCHRLLSLAEFHLPSSLYSMAWHGIYYIQHTTDRASEHSKYWQIDQCYIHSCVCSRCSVSSRVTHIIHACIYVFALNAMRIVVTFVNMGLYFIVVALRCSFLIPLFQHQFFGACRLAANNTCARAWIWINHYLCVWVLIFFGINGAYIYYTCCIDSICINDDYHHHYCIIIIIISSMSLLFIVFLRRLCCSLRLLRFLLMGKYTQITHAEKNFHRSHQ